MNRTVLLLLLFLVLGAGAWYALRKDKTAGTMTAPDMDFAIKNTDDITKIFLADRQGRTVTLERKDGYWLYNGTERARPTAVKNLLHTMSRLTVKYVPPKNAIPVMVRDLAAGGIKVEVYGRNNELIKSYYVGGASADARGTFMIMDGAETPYVVHDPAMVGQVNAYYLMNGEDWLDRTIFREQPEKITEISVEYPQQKSESFRLEKTGTAEFAIRPFFSTTRLSPFPQRKGVAEAYLLQFETLVAEAIQHDNPDRDSITALVPFAIITVKNTDGGQREARFWPVEIAVAPSSGETYVDRYHTLVDGQQLMLTQQRVFGPVFRGYTSFFEGGKAVAR